MVKVKQIRPSKPLEPIYLINDPIFAKWIGFEILEKLKELSPTAKSTVSQYNWEVSRILGSIEGFSSVNEKQARKLCDIRENVDRWLGLI